MITKVQTWGHSLAVRIPQSVAKDTQLSSGNPMELRRHFPQREDELLVMLVHLERL